MHHPWYVVVAGCALAFLLMGGAVTLALPYQWQSRDTWLLISLVGIPGAFVLVALLVNVPALFVGAMILIGIMAMRRT